MDMNGSSEPMGAAAHGLPLRERSEVAAARKNPVGDAKSRDPGVSRESPSETLAATSSCRHSWHGQAPPWGTGSCCPVCSAGAVGIGLLAGRSSVDLRGGVCWQHVRAGCRFLAPKTGDNLEVAREMVAVVQQQTHGPAAVSATRTMLMRGRMANRHPDRQSESNSNISNRSAESNDPRQFVNFGRV